MIFARDLNKPVATLIKKIDAATEQHKDAKMGSFVVFLGESAGLNNKLKEVAEKEGDDAPREFTSVLRDLRELRVLRVKADVTAGKALERPPSHGFTSGCESSYRLHD